MIHFVKNLSEHPRKILQCGLDENVIKEWDCLNECARQLNIHAGHIGECAKGKRKTAGGFKWKYIDLF